MTGLIVGELTIGQRKVKDPAVERLEARLDEPATQEDTTEEETSEEETTEETTEPETVPETTASAPPVTASAADFNNPQTVDRARAIGSSRLLTQDISCPTDMCRRLQTR